jgi:hypothetical protein
MIWTGHSARMREMRNAYKTLVGKPKGKIPLKKPSCRCEDNIMLDIREVGLENVDWIHLAQDRNRWRALMDTAMNFQVTALLNKVQVVNIWVP